MCILLEWIRQRRKPAVVGANAMAPTHLGFDTLGSFTAIEPLMRPRIATRQILYSISRASIQTRLLIFRHTDVSIIFNVLESSSGLWCLLATEVTVEQIGADSLLKWILLKDFRHPIQDGTPGFWSTEYENEPIVQQSAPKTYKKNKFFNI